MTGHRVAGVVVAIVGAALAGGCEGAPSIVDPAGPGAGRIALLWWIMISLLGAVTLLVLALVAVALFRRRDGESEGRPPARLLILGGGVALPAAVAVTLMVLTVTTIVAVPTISGRATGVDREPDIEVVGAQFWWEARYTGTDAVTANEIHIPVGRPVVLALTSADVIHSLWVPRLHGKIDLNPGHTTYLTLEADRPGVYRGQCAEFCGIQHALMGLLVIAEPEEEYEAWLARMASPAPEPEGEDEEAGLGVFLGAGCGACHTIRGTPADGDVGPDLTHLASRLTLGAGAVPNTRGHLGGWIVDSQSIKPGNEMPPMPLDSEELTALLDYLEALR